MNRWEIYHNKLTRDLNSWEGGKSPRFGVCGMGEAQHYFPHPSYTCHKLHIHVPLVFTMKNASATSKHAWNHCRTQIPPQAKYGNPSRIPNTRCSYYAVKNAYSGGSSLHVDTCPYGDRTLFLAHVHAILVRIQHKLLTL